MKIIVMIVWALFSIFVGVGLYTGDELGIVEFVVVIMCYGSISFVCWELMCAEVYRRGRIERKSVRKPKKRERM